jgi:hypothetical protein
VGTTDRVVIGRYFESAADGRSYLQEVAEGGSVYFNMPPGVYDQLDTATAGLINEGFLRRQLESGVARIDFVGETVAEACLAIGSGRWREIRFLDEHAAEYGYRFVEAEQCWKRVGAQ